MKKAMKLLIIMIFVLTLIPFNVNASPGTKNIKQAQKLYDNALVLREKADNLKKIGEKTSANIFRREANQKLHEAIGLLAHVLGENPRDEVALFTLGIVYFQTGKWNKARKKFAQCATNEKMRLAIYGFYKIESNRLAGKDSITQSLRLMREACLFRPKDRRIQAELNEMSKTYFSQGVNFLSMSQHQGAYEYFLTAITLNEKYSLPCAQKMIEIAESLENPIEQIRLSVQAYKLDDSVHDQAIETAKIACGNAKATGNQRTINKVKADLKSFGQQDYSYVVAATWPPKSWKTVYKKSFVGVGYTGGDDKKYNDGGIWTAKCGRDVLRGDRITVIDSNFEHWYDGGWKKYLKEKKLDVYKIQLGDYLTFRNEKGKKFTVVVERRM